MVRKTKRDLDTINKLKNRDELIVEYQNTQDLSMAFEIIDKRNQRKKQIAEQNKTTPKQTYHVFTIEDDKDAQIVKLLLQQNNIKFDYKITNKGDFNYGIIKRFRTCRGISRRWKSRINVLDEENMEIRAVKINKKNTTKIK